MTHLSLRVALVLVAAFTPALYSQQIQSTFADLTVPGHWQEAKQFAAAHFGTDIFYDSATGAVLQISQHRPRPFLGASPPSSTPPQKHIAIAHRHQARRAAVDRIGVTVEVGGDGNADL